MKYSIYLCIFLSLAAASLFAATHEKAVPIPETSMEEFIAKTTSMVSMQKSLAPDVKRKKQECMQLVDAGAAHLERVPLEIACHDFMYSGMWRFGEIFNFLLDDEGIILCHGDANNLIWKNINQIPAVGKESVFNVIKQVTEAGQWLYYIWNNGFKLAYIRKVVLQDKIFYLGAGFFPLNKDDVAEQLVKAATTYFRTVPRKAAFTRVSNPADIFVSGDITMFVGDFKGNIVADASDQAFIGQNLINLKDDKGNFVVQNFIQTMKRVNATWIQEGWLRQKYYVEKIADQKDQKEYYFAAGYNPRINELSAVELLAKAVKHVKEVGSKKAFNDFSNPFGPFTNGRITLAVYDFDGKNLANGEYQTLIGQNLINRKGTDGRFITQEIISLAREHGEGIIDTYNKNAHEKLFVKSVNTPEGSFIIVAGIYIHTKAMTVEALVKKVICQLLGNGLVEMLKKITYPTGEFYIGDIYAFVYTPEGIALANGEYKNMIWHDYAKSKDANGAQVIESIITLAKNGGGWLSYSSRNARRRVYVRPVLIDNPGTNKKELFIVGSGYFL